VPVEVRRLVWVIAALASVVLTGCTTGAPDGRNQARTVAWHRVHLPAGLAPLTVTRLGHGLLVGAAAQHASSVPRLLLLGHGDGWSRVPLTPTSYYAHRARWKSVITAGHRIYALGQASGGAHGNPRWTAWSGNPRGVREDPQPFDTFGGEGAGVLTGMGFLGRRPVVVGSWTNTTVGLDVSVWTLSGHTWTRHSSAGSALASDHSALNSVRAVVSAAPGLVLAGSVTTLGGGQVGLVPAIWRASAPTGSWLRLLLPADDAGEATGADCDSSSCLVVGYVGTRLALWSVADLTVERDVSLPAVPVGLNTVSLVGRSGPNRATIMTTTRGRSRLLTKRAAGWTSAPGPTGTATGWASLSGRTFVVTTRPDGRTALWAGRVPPPP
jgi:hypothetical protein